MNKSAATETSELVAKSGVDVSQEAQTPSAPLTDEERALLNEIAADKDFIALRQMHNTLLFKMKIAIGHDKERFKEAIVNNDAKAFMTMMNFSDSEYRQFIKEFKAKTDKFNSRFAANKGTLENLQKRSLSGCKTCQTDMNNLNADAIDEQMQQILQVNANIEERINNTEQECLMNNPTGFRTMKEVQTACTVASFACSAGFMFFCPPCILACLAGFGVCMYAAACDNCGIC